MTSGRGVSVRKALALSMVAHYSKLAVNIVAVMTLARLLSPAEIGVFSVGAAFMMLAQVFRDFGTTSYLIQEKELTRERIRTAFSVTWLVAWGFAALSISLAEPIAHFYGAPELALVIRILSLNLVLLPFAAPVVALLRRDMRFDVLLRITLAASLIQPATSIVLAWLGFSFYSLAWGAVANSAAMVILASIARPKDAWVLPGFSEWRRIFGFGMQWSVTGLLERSSFYINDLVVGRLLGFTEVGLFSRALGLINLFQERVMDSVHNVVLPAFAGKHRSGGNLAIHYLDAITLLTGIAWPFFGFVALMAFPTVRVLYGDQWDAAVPLVRILCVGAAVYTLWSIAGHALVASGRIDLKMRAALVVQLSYVGGVALAALVSLQHVALAYLGMSLLGVAVNGHYLRKAIGVPSSAIIRAGARSLVPTLATLALPAVVVERFGWSPENPLLILLLAVLGGSAGWLSAVILARHPLLSEMKQAWSGIARHFRRGGV